MKPAPSNSGPDVEFVYALGPGEPRTFASGSFEDVAQAAAEAEAINADRTPEPGAPMSPGARHFITRLAEGDGATDTAQEALADYEDQVLAGRAAFLDRLRQS